MATIATYFAVKEKDGGDGGDGGGGDGGGGDGGGGDGGGGDGGGGDGGGGDGERKSEKTRMSPMFRVRSSPGSTSVR